MSEIFNKIAIGTAQFGLNYGVSNQNGKVDSDGIQSILNFAHDNNINTLDTAKGYGNSEKSIGDYLNVTKKNWNIITKLNSNKDVIEQIQDSKEKLTIMPSPFRKTYSWGPKRIIKAIYLV